MKLPLKRYWSLQLELPQPSLQVAQAFLQYPQSEKWTSETGHMFGFIYSLNHVTH